MKEHSLHSLTRLSKGQWLIDAAIICETPVWSARDGGYLPALDDGTPLSINEELDAHYRIVSNAVAHLK